MRKRSLLSRCPTYNHLYTDCILVIRHPDDGHMSDRNMLVKTNSIMLNIFIYVHLLVYHKIIKYSVQLVCDDL
jgi:hypothetical protein